MLWGQGPTSFFCHVYPVILASFVEQTILFPTELSWDPYQKLLTVNLRIYFWILNSVSLSILMPSPCYFSYCCFAVSLEVSKVSPPTLLPFSRLFQLFWLLAFSYEFGGQLVNLCRGKKAATILIEIMMKL